MVAPCPIRLGKGQPVTPSLWRNVGMRLTVGSLRMLLEDSARSARGLLSSLPDLPCYPSRSDGAYDNFTSSVRL